MIICTVVFSYRYFSDRSCNETFFAEDSSSFYCFTFNNRLAMGALNRAYGPHGGHGHEGDHASHAEDMGQVC